MKLMPELFALASFVVAIVTVPIIFAQNAQPSANPPSLDDLAPIEQNGKWGYANKYGNVVIKPQFSGVGRFSDGLALVWSGGRSVTDPGVLWFVKMGYIDRNGHWVIQSRFMYYFFYDFSEGLVPFRQQFSKWGYMDRTGKIVIRPRFDWAANFSGDTAPVLMHGICAHIDKTGRIIDQSQTVLPRTSEQDRHGTYLFKPESPPCS